jgi:hypothetical protein
MVGELSFRVVARRFILSHRPSGVVPNSFGDRFPYRDGMIERWTAEAAILARPFLEVEVRRLLLGGYAFLRALSEGKTVATAVGIATEVAPKFDVVSSLRLIDDAKVVVGISGSPMVANARSRRLERSRLRGARGMAVVEPSPHLFPDWLSQPSCCRYELVLELCHVSARHSVDHWHFWLTHRRRDAGFVDGAGFGSERW